MSYEQRQTQAYIDQMREQKNRDDIYASLERQKADIEASTQSFIDRATTLHTSSPAPDKPDVIAMRDELIANLRAILGV